MAASPTVFYAVLSVLCLSGSSATGQASAPLRQSDLACPDDEHPAGNAQDHKPDPAEQAWTVLCAGLRSEKTEERATAVRVLSLLRGQASAVHLASQALKDEKPEVRTSAGVTLGELRAKSAIPQLREALADKDLSVVLACAHALVQVKDASGYEVYYEILTGERKGSPGLVASQLATIKDPKKLALMGFQEGIGFVPFAGIGYEAYRTIVKNDSSPVRAAAATMLIGDPDPATGSALAEQAVGDKNYLVRVAALEALARRGDPSFIEKIAPAMSDDKAAVKYTAAAAVAHLSAVTEKKEPPKDKP